MKYALTKSHSTMADFLDWKCYYGRTHYASPGDKRNEVRASFEGVDWYKPNPPSFWLEDPTHGYLASYTEGCKHISKLLVSNENGVTLKTMLIPSSGSENDTPKMATLRLEDKKEYNGGVFIMDVEQIPHACMAWPAFWLVGNKEGEWTNADTVVSTWPNYGEIDIIEQINGQTNNHTTLHTKPGCKTQGSLGGVPIQYKSGGMSSDTPPVYNDCNKGPEGSKTGGEIGCGIDMGPDSGGKLTTDKPGGIYACEWVPNKSIKYWFWKSGDPKIPADIKKDSKDVDTSTWTSDTYTGHDLASCTDDYFQNLHMIINTTVCGDWAGNTPGGGNPDKDCTWNEEAPDSDSGGDPSLMVGCQKKLIENIERWGCKDKDSTKCYNPNLPELEPFQWKIRYVNTYEIPTGIPPDSDIPWTWIGVGGGVLVVVIVACIFFFKKKPQGK